MFGEDSYVLDNIFKMEQKHKEQQEAKIKGAAARVTHLLTQTKLPSPKKHKAHFQSPGFWETSMGMTIKPPEKEMPKAQQSRRASWTLMASAGGW